MPINDDPRVQLLQDEIIQRREEGCAVDGFESLLAQAGDPEALDLIYQQLQSLQPVNGDDEPSDLEKIRKTRPEGSRRLQLLYGEDMLYNRLLGGWLGRCAGCQLGKPVEGWIYQNVGPTRSIKNYLQGANAYPLDDYIPQASPGWEGQSWARIRPEALPATREHLRWAARDDDQDYTILGLDILETYGPNFTTTQVGEKWLKKLPYMQVYTAERQAYRNLVEGFVPPQTAIRWNPYREWIGAQIRADGFAYAAPGWMELAAEFAWRDAALSHVKNGIYGEMFFAAAISAAFVARDVQQVIHLALEEIPRASRFARMVVECLEWCENCPDWFTAREKVEQVYGHYHWVHTLNNAALVILALLYGQGDFGKTICLAVMGGWDTDCNGATAGSILGVLLGADRLPSRWIAPLNDTLQSAVFGFSEVKISEMARRSLGMAQKILS